MESIRLFNEENIRPNLQNAASNVIAKESKTSTATTTSSKKTKWIDVLVTNIASSEGTAISKIDLKIELLECHDGLLTLVNHIFEHGFRQALKNHGYVTSHLWILRFAGVTYEYGWRTNFGNAANKDRGVPPCNSRDIDYLEPRLFDNLPSGPVKVGQRGSFSGRSGQFEFEVKALRDATVKMTNGNHNPKSVVPTTFRHNTMDEICSGKYDIEEPDRPFPPVKVHVIQSKLTSNLAADFLTPEQATKALSLRKEFDAYFSGNNEWRRDRGGTYVAKKPLIPEWDAEEETMIGLLILSDCKFKKSWDNILQYGLVTRSQSASQAKWYQLRKQQSYRLEHMGRGIKTKEERIFQAKKLALKRWGKINRSGVPTLGPKPLTYSERMIIAREHVKNGGNLRDMDPESPIRNPQELVRKRRMLSDIMMRNQRAKHN